MRSWPFPNREASRLSHICEPFVRAVATRLDDDLCGDQSRFDRRADAFAALRIGQPGRVADEKQSSQIRAARGRETDTRGPAIAPPDRLGWQMLAPAKSRRTPASRPRHACGSRLPRPMFTCILLAKAPAVTLEVGTEVQLRPSGAVVEAPDASARNGNSASCATTTALRVVARIVSRRATGHQWPPAPTSTGAATAIVDHPAAASRR